MKKYLLIFITLFISSSCWSQFNIKEFASSHSEYSEKRINSTDEFLKSLGVDLGNKDQMAMRLNRYKGYDFYYYLYNNGRVVIVVTASSPETIKSFNSNELFLPTPILEALLKKQNSDEKLTEVLNLDNTLTTDANNHSRIIQELNIPTNESKSIENKSFRGAVSIFITLSRGEQLQLEYMTFLSMQAADFEKRWGDEEKFRNTYSDMSRRRDFRNSLVLYTKTSDPYISDRNLAEGIMNRLFRELEGSNYKELTDESVSILSRGPLFTFIEKVCEVHPELKPFYTFVDEWQTKFAELSLNELSPEYQKIAGTDVEKERNNFYKRIGKEIKAYIITYKDRPSFTR